MITQNRKPHTGERRAGKKFEILSSPNAVREKCKVLHKFRGLGWGVGSVVVEFGVLGAASISFRRSQNPLKEVFFWNLWTENPPFWRADDFLGGACCRKAAHGPETAMDYGRWARPLLGEDFAGSEELLDGRKRAF